MNRKIIVRLIGGIGNQWFSLFGGLYFAECYGLDLIVDPRYVDFKHGRETILNTCRENTPFKVLDSGDKFHLSGKSRQRLRMFKLEELLFMAHIVRDDAFLHEDLVTHKILSLLHKRVSELGFWKRKIIIESYLQDFYYYDELIRTKGSPWIRELFRSGYAANLQNRCAVHIRLGDFYSELRDRLGVLSKKYYLEAMSRVREVYPKVVFDVFSNDTSLARELYGELETFKINWIEPNQHNQSRFTSDSFLLFAKYPLKILGNSTFGFAASKIHNSQSYVFYPAPMFRKAETKGIRSIPDSWIPISSDFL